MSVPRTFRRTPRALWRRVGDEVLVADAEGSDVSSLSASASAAWLLLEEPRTREELIDGLVAGCELPAIEVAKHVDRMLHEFERREWVVRVVDDG